jgi:hypothetical protein
MVAGVNVSPAIRTVCSPPAAAPASSPPAAAASVPPSAGVAAAGGLLAACFEAMITGPDSPSPARNTTMTSQPHGRPRGRAGGASSTRSLTAVPPLAARRLLCGSYHAIDRFGQDQAGCLGRNLARAGG